MIGNGNVLNHSFLYGRRAFLVNSAKVHPILVQSLSNIFLSSLIICTSILARSGFLGIISTGHSANIAIKVLYLAPNECN